MKKKQATHQVQHHHAKDSSELVKAVAQAWLSHSSKSKPTGSEFDARRRNFQTKPSRFKLEALKKAAMRSEKWDFNQSLWDSYEIVAVSKRLERALVLDYEFSGLFDEGKRIVRRKKESKNSLRNLFNNMSSRRFSECKIPRDGNAKSL
ncbi:hypothetical protein Ancab_035809 [Ancistrocladus abbreviatus]